MGNVILPRCRCLRDIKQYFKTLKTKAVNIIKRELHSKNKLYSYEKSYFNQLNPEKPEKSPSLRRHVVFLEQTRIVNAFHILISLSAFSLDGIVVLQAITMSIVVERSSDYDYSSLSSCSFLGENLDKIFIKFLQGYRFQPIQDSYNSKSRESLEAQISQMEEEDEYCMWLLLDWVT